MEALLVRTEEVEDIADVVVGCGKLSLVQVGHWIQSVNIHMSTPPARGLTTYLKSSRRSADVIQILKTDEGCVSMFRRAER